MSWYGTDSCYKPLKNHFTIYHWQSLNRYKLLHARTCHLNSSEMESEQIRHEADGKGVFRVLQLVLKYTFEPSCENVPNPGSRECMQSGDSNFLSYEEASTFWSNNLGALMDWSRNQCKAGCFYSQKLGGGNNTVFEASCCSKPTLSS